MKPFTWKEHGVSYLISISLSLQYVTILFSRNAQDIQLSHAAQVLGVVCGAGLFFMAALFFITRNIWFNSILVNLILLFCLTYGYLETFIHNIGSRIMMWHIVPVFLFLIACAVITVRNINLSSAKKILAVFACAFLALSVMNLVTGSAVYIQTKAAKAKAQNPDTTQINIDYVELEDTPDVYLIIMDEYTPFHIMREAFGIENRRFETFLKEHNFYVSYSSKNTSHQTAKVTANLLNMDYVVELNEAQTVAFYRRNNPAIISYFKSRGYLTYTVEKGLANDWLVKSSDISHSGSGDLLVNFRVLIQSNSILKYMNTEVSKKDLLLSSFNYIKAQAAKGNKPKFLFAHFMSPHYPFALTDEKSAQSAGNSREGYEKEWVEVGNYLEDMLSEIITNNPDSIIILQSDHGFKSLPVHEQAHSVLNAVYYRGQIYDSIEGLSGINTVRKIVSEVLCLNLEPVEDFDYRPAEDVGVIADFDEVPE